MHEFNKGVFVAGALAAHFKGSVPEVHIKNQGMHAHSFLLTFAYSLGILNNFNEQYVILIFF